MDNLNTCSFCEKDDAISRSALLNGGIKAKYGYNEDGILLIPMRDVLDSIKNAPSLDVTPVITGETSDGYHTFNELYHHRAVLFSVIVKAFPDRAWKSRKHHDGSMYDGMFIVGIETPDGQASYHYDINPYWDMFQCKELEYAPEWDGHTPAQAIDRIGKLEPVLHGRWIYRKTIPGFHYCSICGVTNKMQVSCNKYVMLRYCPNCGARMDGEANEKD